MKSLFAVAALAALLAACAGERAPWPSDNVAPPDALHLIAGLETARGAFEGRDGYGVTGTVSVFRTGGKWYVSLGRDFRFDGAPDAKLAFGADGFEREAILGPLLLEEGTSLYEVVPPLDVGDYTEVWLWSEASDMPLGYARLTLL